MKSASAAGLDGISTKVVQKLTQKLSPAMVHLIEIIFNSGHYPAAFKIAMVTPIHKGGSKSKADNYRPISVLPVLNKIVERVIYKRIVEFVEPIASKSLLYNFQFGFRQKSGTENAATELVNEISQALDNKKIVSAVFMDLRKAFDLVDHEALLNVLEKYGIRGKPLEVIKSYLENRRQVVKIGQK